MPDLPRNLKAKNAKSHPAQHPRAGWDGLKPADLQDLAEKMKQQFDWEHAPREFQLDAIRAQLLRKDVLIHAGTGSGKTTVAAGPHAHESTKGMVTFMISPLIALQEEQVKTFEKEFKLTAMAVNSAHGGCTMEVMQDICAGRWQIVIISPELILTKQFISNVLRNKEMNRRILSVVVDEAHVVSHWGSGFRKKYGTLGILRALLPKGTPMVAMSATLPARVREDVLNKLQYNQNDCTYLNLGNDRHNVSIVVRAMQHPMNSYRDLDFLIPKGIKDRGEIKKTWIYVDNVNSGIDVTEYLYGLLPDSYRDEGIIYNYNAIFSSKNRAGVMDLFKAGVVRILVCTDAAGMGCNVPDIDIVVQFKLSSSISSFVQHAGRAARGFGRAGLAVLLVERSVYDADLLQAHLRQNSQDNNKGKKKRTSVREKSEYPKAKDKDYAESHGVKRGAFGGKSDKVGLMHGLHTSRVVTFP